MCLSTQPMNRRPPPFAQLVPWGRALGRALVGGSDPRRQGWLTAVSIALVVGIGFLDFIVDDDDHVSFRLFYSIAVMLAVTARGWGFGAVIALASVGVMTAGDLQPEGGRASALVLTWNAVISLGTYALIIWLLASLLNLHREVEQRVQDGARALAREATERERLERVIVNHSEKERMSIGHDLHDGLCQHLMGTAYVARMLADDLRSQDETQAARARRVVSLIDEGVAQTRHLAKGLLLTAIEADGLVAALEELASTASEQFRVRCEFFCDGDLRLTKREAASNLYRIAQEAVRNAARHGRPEQITITLEVEAPAVTLRIRDDGVGLPQVPAPGGLGLRIMSYRAGVIGATYSVESVPEGGTCITCRLPREVAVA
jgi:signal transduction histidine kinase